MTKCFDLHCHSSASDGELMPSELVQRAAEMGVEVLSLTDHDTVAGVAAAQVAAGQHGIELIPGIELSAQWRRRTIHVVGLNIDICCAQLLESIAALEVVRTDRARQIAIKLEKVGVKNALAGAEAFAQGAVIGRPHFAAHMVATGFVKNSTQAFKRYLGAGKIGDIGNVWPELAEVVGLIVSAGGIAVLAHPDKYNLTRTKLRELISDFVEVGGSGLEVVSSQQDPKVTQSLADLCTSFSLLASTGSDFHRQGQPWQELGHQSLLPENLTPVWSRF